MGVCRLERKLPSVVHRGVLLSRDFPFTTEDRSVVPFRSDNEREIPNNSRGTAPFFSFSFFLLHPCNHDDRLTRTRVPAPPLRGELSHKFSPRRAPTGNSIFFLTNNCIFPPLRALVHFYRSFFSTRAILFAFCWNSRRVGTIEERKRERGI